MAVIAQESRPTAGRLMGGVGAPIINCNTTISRADVYVRTDAPGGLYICTSANVWTILSAGGGGGTWGSITGTLSSQTDLQTALNLKSPLASPTFTGTVTVPTPFTLGAVSVLPTGTEMNFVDGVTSSIQAQIDTKVTGPASATDNAVVRYNLTTGKLVQDSAVTIADITGDVVTPGSITAASYGTSATSAGTVAICEPTGTGSDCGTIAAPSSITTAYTLTLPAATAGSSLVSYTVASGTSALGTSAISSGACATAVTTAATGTVSTDVVWWGFNTDVTAITGYAPVTTGMLTIFANPIADNVVFRVCNSTSSSISPGAVTLNWRIIR